MAVPVPQIIKFGKLLQVTMKVWMMTTTCSSLLGTLLNVGK